jgi:hypothetical protein
MAPAIRTIDDGGAALDTAYTLTLLGEYAYTLDGLPSELARHFADLRELDAVLAGSMAAITAKVQRLTALIEQGNVSGAPAVTARKAERLRLLGALAAEAERVKPGSEDKIRVAGLCADALKASALHMSAVLDAVPGRDFDAAVLARDTLYPHVDPEGSSGYTHWKQHHKRHAGTYGHAIIDSPIKKRRLYNQEDELNALTRSPRKDKTAARNGARGKKSVAWASSLYSILTQRSETNVPRHPPNPSSPSPPTPSPPPPASPPRPSTAPTATPPPINAPVRISTIPHTPSRPALRTPRSRGRPTARACSVTVVTGTRAHTSLHNLHPRPVRSASAA